MWTANIQGSNIDRKLGTVLVTVEYVLAPDNNYRFSETIDMTGGAIETLSQKVASRLNTLNTNEALYPQIPNGEFTPEVVVNEDPLAEARKILLQLKQDVDLGIVKTTDQVYTDALTAARTAYEVKTGVVEATPVDTVGPANSA